ncbi:MAG TPA: ATPase domain-containing protein [Vicinamibacterales bacterium]|nr:ATPase domain-containing protein [Vicinamibacterales bacterium]
MRQTAGPSAAHPGRKIVATGIEGLDHVLAGGLTAGRLYLVEGVPGSGKTTLAMQCLIAGAARGETVRYVTLSETEEELRAVSLSHGWDISSISIHEVVPSESDLDPELQNTMYHPAEIELAETTKRILREVEDSKPAFVVFDSLSELRLLAGSPLRFRRQIMALKQFFSKRAITVLLIDDMTSTDRDLQVQSIAHGVIVLDQLNPEYGTERRRLRVAKMRGVRFRGGYHDYVIRRGGLDVFPRLVAAEHRQVADRALLPSGVPELDRLLGGGIEAGTSTLIVGAAGTGKSTLAAQFASAAALAGVRGAMFIFDESPATLLSRCRQLRIALPERVEEGRITLQQVDPAELTPGEFVHTIRRAVEHDGARVIVIDSLNGYLSAMPEEHFLTIQLHELLMYLGQRGVATLMISAHQGMVGTAMNSPVDASYLSDAVILMRYFEASGELRQAISVVKKRGGQHERSIREFRTNSGRIEVGRRCGAFAASSRVCRRPSERIQRPRQQCHDRGANRSRPARPVSRPNRQGRRDDGRVVSRLGHCRRLVSNAGRAARWHRSGRGGHPDS